MLTDTHTHLLTHAHTYMNAHTCTLYIYAHTYIESSPLENLFYVCVKSIFILLSLSQQSFLTWGEDPFNSWEKHFTWRSKDVN